MGKVTASIADRFWSKVEKTDTCWLWRGTVFKKNGYGGFQAYGRLHRAHRFAWEITNGPILDGLFVCHRCDVKLCVRPDHLFLGTAAENNRDKILKLRDAFGERQGIAAFTNAQVRLIRAVHAAGLIVDQSALARGLGVTHGCINNMLHRRSYRRVI